VKIMDGIGARSEEDKLICIILLSLFCILIKAVKQLRRDIKDISLGLDALPDVDSRVGALSKKHVQLASPFPPLSLMLQMTETRRADRQQATARRRVDEVRPIVRACVLTWKALKERDGFKAEIGRAALAKTKLENLCRELQRQNRLVKVGSECNHWLSERAGREQAAGGGGAPEAPGPVPALSGAVCALNCVCVVSSRLRACSLSLSLSLSLYIYIYIYISICMYIARSLTA
jgi:hypothetical protein